MNENSLSWEYYSLLETSISSRKRSLKKKNQIMELLYTIYTKELENNHISPRLTGNEFGYGGFLH